MQVEIERFFAAWSHTDAGSRTATIRGALGETASYSDPRSGGRLVGVDAISEYVGQFAANAPGWTAVVNSVDEVNGYAKAIVSFGGLAPTVRTWLSSARTLLRLTRRVRSWPWQVSSAGKGN